MRKLLIPCSLVGLTAVACWGASRGPSAPPEPSATSPAASNQSAPPAGTPSVSREPLDLRNFTPLLDEAELRAVREADDAGRPADAALLLAQLAPAADAAEQARRSFLQGLLYTRASESARARQAFLDAGRFDGSLQADAWLRAGESFLAEGQATQALAAAKQAHFAAPEARQILLQARSHAALGELDSAERLYRQAGDLAIGADVRMEWIRLQVERCRKESNVTEQRALARQALVDLAALLLTLPRDHALSVEGRKLSEQLVIWAAAAPPVPDRSAHLARLSALLDQNALEEAAELVSQIVFEPKDWSTERCQYQSLLGKLRSLERKWGEAAEAVQPASERCQEDPALHARLLFNAGKYAAADGRDARAVRSYAELERRYPESSLADDARLRAARSYKDMGVPARFVELLSSLPEDYPDGDMTWEGVLELALYRMERKDWAGAALILEGGARAVEAKDAARGPEFSGCERYFLARARGELGKRSEELDEYQRIVEDLPLSYYMLHAYSRLHEADPARAERALDEGVSRARQRPFAFPYRVEYDSAEFKRALDLLRVSEIAAGRQVLGRLGLGADGDQSILWGLALLYDRAGDSHQSFGIAQGKLSDWFSHYPEGDWERPWQLGFPRPYHSIVERESRSTGVPEWFIYGIMREESTFDPEAESPAAAYGLMQLIVPTARTIGQKAGLPYSPAALKKPSVNIALGSRVLSSLTKQFPANPWLAIPGYNAGPNRPRRWLRERPDVDFDVWVELIPFRETRRYTKRVLSSRAAYAFVYERQNAEAALLLPRRLTLP